MVKVDCGLLSIPPATFFSLVMQKPKPGKTRKNSEVVGFHSVDWDDEWGDFLIYCFYLGFLDILFGSENKGFRESMRLFWWY